MAPEVKMRILVTGSTGFIGSNLRTYLESKGHDVHGCSRSPVGGRSKFLLVSGESALKHDYDAKHYILDLKDGPSVSKMLREVNPEAIIHCAANPLVKPDPENPTAVYDDNVKSTHLLCNYAPEGCVFVLMSSIVVYGDLCKIILPSEHIHPIPTSMYGVSKVAAENVMEFHRAIHGVSLRLGATIGPNLSHGIIYDFLRKLNSEAEFLEVLGDRPGSRKPFLHISDLYMPIELALSRQLATDSHRVFNVCNNTYASVEDIANAVMEVSGIHKEIKWLGSAANWKGDNNILRANTDEMFLTHNWKPQLDSIEAIKRAVKENL